MPTPRVQINSSHGTILAHATTGEILNIHQREEQEDLSFIKRFDIEEWRRRNGTTNLLAATLFIRQIDILEIGYWHGENNTYEPPEADFLKQIRSQPHRGPSLLPKQTPCPV